MTVRATSASPVVMDASQVSAQAHSNRPVGSHLTHQVCPLGAAVHLCPALLHSCLCSCAGEVNRPPLTLAATTNGGAVFSTGSIAWGQALPCNEADNYIARITSNVIERFMRDGPLKF